MKPEESLFGKTHTQDVSTRRLYTTQRQNHSAALITHTHTGTTDRQKTWRERWKDEER